MSYIRHDAVLVATEDYRDGDLPDVDDYHYKATVTVGFFPAGAEASLANL